MLGETGRYGRGGSLIARDLDADGDVDLLFGRLTAPPDVYRNDGEGGFTLAESGLTVPEGSPTTKAVADDGVFRFGSPVSRRAGKSRRYRTSRDNPSGAPW